MMLQIYGKSQGGNIILQIGNQSNGRLWDAKIPWERHVNVKKASKMQNETNSHGLEVEVGET